MPSNRSGKNSGEPAGTHSGILRRVITRSINRNRTGRRLQSNFNKNTASGSTSGPKVQQSSVNVMDASSDEGENFIIRGASSRRSIAQSPAFDASTDNSVTFLDGPSSSSNNAHSLDASPDDGSTFAMDYPASSVKSDQPSSSLDNSPETITLSSGEDSPKYSYSGNDHLGEHRPEQVRPIRNYSQQRRTVFLNQYPSSRAQHSRSQTYQLPGRFNRQPSASPMYSDYTPFTTHSTPKAPRSPTAAQELTQDSPLFAEIPSWLALEPRSPLLQDYIHQEELAAYDVFETSQRSTSRSVSPASSGISLRSISRSMSPTSPMAMNSISRSASPASPYSPYTSSRSISRSVSPYSPRTPVYSDSDEDAVISIRTQTLPSSSYRSGRTDAREGRNGDQPANLVLDFAPTSSISIAPRTDVVHDEDDVGEDDDDETMSQFRARFKLARRVQEAPRVWDNDVHESSSEDGEEEMEEEDLSEESSDGEEMDEDDSLADVSSGDDGMESDDPESEEEDDGDEARIEHLNQLDHEEVVNDDGGPSLHALIIESMQEDARREAQGFDEDETNMFEEDRSDYEDSEGDLDVQDRDIRELVRRNLEDLVRDEDEEEEEENYFADEFDLGVESDDEEEEVVPPMTEEERGMLNEYHETRDAIQQIDDELDDIVHARERNRMFGRIRDHSASPLLGFNQNRLAIEEPRRRRAHQGWYTSPLFGSFGEAPLAREESSATPEPRPRASAEVSSHARGHSFSRCPFADFTRSSLRLPARFTHSTSQQRDEDDEDVVGASTSTEQPHRRNVVFSSSVPVFARQLTDEPSSQVATSASTEQPHRRNVIFSSSVPVFARQLDDGQLITQTVSPSSSGIYSEYLRHLAPPAAAQATPQIPVSTVRSVPEWPYGTITSTGTSGQNTLPYFTSWTTSAQAVSIPSTSSSGPGPSTSSSTFPSTTQRRRRHVMVDDSDDDDVDIPFIQRRRARLENYYDHSREDELIDTQRRLIERADDIRAGMSDLQRRNLYRHILLPPRFASGPVGIEVDVDEVEMLTDEYGDCTVCMTSDVSNPKGCTTCKQMVGCNSCTRRWFNAADLGNKCCPLCRSAWTGAEPSVKDMHVIVKEREGATVAAGIVATAN